ncbi:MAG: DNA translocase FtsK [candidate division WOR-3 bacterium]
MELILLTVIVSFTLYLVFISSEEKTIVLERISGLFLAAVSLLFLVSLISYSEGSPLSNFGGIIGYRISNFLVRHLGYILAGYICFLISATGFLTFTGRLKRNQVIELSAVLVALLTITLFLPFPFSGSLQFKISQVLTRYIGIAGKIIFSVTLLLITLFLIKFPSLKLKNNKPKIGKETAELKQHDENVEEKKQTLPPQQPKKVTLKPTPKPEQSDNFLIEPAELIQILKPAEPFDSSESKQELEKNKLLIEEKLREYGIEGKVVGYYPGPVVTRYEYEPAPGIKLSKISTLADDIALRMRSNAIRIVAPLPNKGLVGFEIPNKHRKTVYLRALVEREEFFNLESPLGFALGVDTAGNPVYADLANMPHLLIAGSTGSGKSVCINTIITSIVFKNSPKKVRFIFIDPKRIELSLYEGIPHLLLPVVKDRKLAVEVLKKAVKWMDYRYKLFAREGAREIQSFNAKVSKNGNEPIPYIVIIIDEFADLIISTGREIEEPLARLAQMARAVGIHLVVATQRPSVDVITGTIKANFPVRIAFKVPSKVDSKTIIDEKGAEKLLGRGDMLFIPPGTSEPIRLHGPFISEAETHAISKLLTRAHLSQILKTYFSPSEEINLIEISETLIDENLHLPLIRRDEPGIEELEERTIDFLSDSLEIDPEEIKEKIDEIRENYYSKIPEMTEIPLEEVQEEEQLQEGEWDPMLEEAAKVVVLEGKASATLLQRKLKLGFARAARVIDQLEQIGVIGPQEGTKPRKVLVKLDDLERIFKNWNESS